MTTSTNPYTGSIRILKNDLNIAWNTTPPPGAGIYEILLPNPIPRLCGTSRTLYIGRSGNLASRMGQLASWGHSVTGRLYAVLDRAGIWGDTPKEERYCTVVARPLGAESDPELEEVRLITAFERAHCELPPLNRASAGNLALLMIQRIMQGIADQLTELDGLGAASVKVRRPWYDEREGVTYVKLAVRKVPRVIVGWVWPEAWSGIAHRPAWWPDGKMPFLHQHLFLFTHSEWEPVGHKPATPSKYWCAAREEEPWLGLTIPVRLDGSLIREPSDAFIALLARGALSNSERAIKPDATISEALRTIWAGVGERIEEVVQLQKVAEAPASGDETG